MIPFRILSPVTGMNTLRSRTIHLAYTKPELRPYLLPMLKEAADHKPGDVWKTIFGGWRAMGRDGEARSFKSQDAARSFIEDEEEEKRDEEEEAKHKKEEEESEEAERKAPVGRGHKEREELVAKLPETIDKAKKRVKDIEDMSDDDYKAMREKDIRKELQEDVIRYEPWAPHGLVEREGLGGKELDEAVKKKMTEIGKDLSGDRKKQVQYAESEVKGYERELAEAKEYTSSEKGKRDKAKYEKAEKEKGEREKAKGEREKAKGEREKRKTEREKRKTERKASLRSRTIRLAHARPELRPYLLPMLKEAGPDYKDYVENKQKKGEKPLKEDEWRAKVLGEKPKEEKPKEEKPGKEEPEAKKDRKTLEAEKGKAHKEVLNAADEADSELRSFDMQDKGGEMLDSLQTYTRGDLTKEYPILNALSGRGGSIPSPLTDFKSEKDVDDYFGKVKGELDKARKYNEEEGKAQGADYSGDINKFSDRIKEIEDAVRGHTKKMFDSKKKRDQASKELEESSQKTASLRTLTIRLAHARPELRPYLLPLLK